MQVFTAQNLVQVSLQQPPQYACACIFLLSEVLKSRPPLWNMVLQNELADEVEHFEDIVEEPDIQANKAADKPGNSGDVADDPSDDEAESLAPSSDDDSSDKQDDNLLGFGGLTDLQESQLQVPKAESTLPAGYDPRHREPTYCNADRVGWWELMVLALHVHPSVSAMAKTLLSGANIVYNGNPLNDLSLGAFLDKFQEKKPKERNWHGGSQIEPTKQVDMSKPLIGADILQLDEMDVAPEDAVFHRFYMNKMKSAKKPKKKKKKGGAGEEDLIGGEEDEDESDNEEIEAILDPTNRSFSLEADGDYDYDDLDEIANEDDNDLVGDDSEEEMEFPMDNVAEEEEVGGDGDVNIGIGDVEDESDDVVKPKKRKGGASPFASLEDYEHLLDDDDDAKHHKTAKRSKPKKKKKVSHRAE